MLAMHGAIASGQRPTGTEDTVERYFARTTRRTTGTVRSSNLSTINTPSWQEWQQAVVSQIRRDFRQVLTEDVGAEDFDWDAWRPFYEQGLSPAQAVVDALLLPA